MIKVPDIVVYIICCLVAASQLLCGISYIINFDKAYYGAMTLEVGFGLDYASINNGYFTCVILVLLGITCFLT